MISKVIFNTCTKFFATVHIEGVIYSEASTLINVTSTDKRFINSTVLQNKIINSKNIFSLQIFLSENNFNDNLELTFIFTDCSHKVKLGDINLSIASKLKNKLKLPKQWLEYLQDDSYKTMLDIGGRARSGVLYANKYRDTFKKDVTILDIVEDKDVNIVCDCHEMSKYLPSEYFDIILSSAVFEHLIMPWKVAIEMNRVMKKGAVAYIGTHQTIGMHDLPWDFYRFSDTSWHGIFNEHTGFEILGTELSELQYIVPFCYEDKLANFEKSAGFRGSSVLIKKISDSKMEWDLNAKDVVNNLYPED
ncbi:MAG: methyltransferase domain-containing protein [Arcobacter sp.]|uniref:methyltransferase domain-containing protein n=1 Tax=Arcobacter sp. TaxID=1872629 RepID=UPI003AFFA58B